MTVTAVYFDNTAQKQPSTVLELANAMARLVAEGHGSDPLFLYADGVLAQGSIVLSRITTDDGGNGEVWFGDSPPD